MAPPTPRWLPIVGWVLLGAGILSAVADVARAGDLGLGWLALNLLLDAFLVVGGLLIVRSTR